MAESRDWSEEFNVLVDECSLPFKGRVKEGFNVLHARAKSKLENSQTGPKFLKKFSRVMSICQENRRKRDLTDAEVEDATSVTTVNKLLTELMCPDDMDMTHDDADSITRDNASGVWGRTLRQAIRGRHTPMLLIKRCEILLKCPQEHFNLDLIYRDLNLAHQWLDDLHEEKHHHFWYLKTLTEIKLRQYESANTSLTQAKLALDYSDLSPETRKTRRKKLARGEVTIKNGGGKNLEKPEPPGMPPEVPKLAGGHSEAIPNVSSKLELEERFLVAREDIKVGEVLMVEAPTFTAPCPSTESQTVYQCSHCLVPTKLLLPCPDCRYAMFCSVECKSEALKGYHGRGECRSGILGVGRLINLGHEPIETTMVLSLRQLFSKPLSQFLKNKKPSMSGTDDEEQHEGEIREVITSPRLGGKTVLMVEMLMRVLRSCKCWIAEALKDKCDIENMVDVLWRLVSSSKISALDAVYPKERARPKMMANQDLTRSPHLPECWVFGQALCKVSSMLCPTPDANCLLMFSGPKVVLVCFRPVGNGDPVSVNLNIKGNVREKLLVPKDGKDLLGGFYAKVREGVDRPGIVAALAAFGGSLDVLYSIYRHLPRPVMLDFFLPHYSAARIAFLSMFNQTILD